MPPPSSPPLVKKGKERPPTPIKLAFNCPFNKGMPPPSSPPLAKKRKTCTCTRWSRARKEATSTGFVHNIYWLDVWWTTNNKSFQSIHIISISFNCTNCLSNWIVFRLFTDQIIQYPINNYYNCIALYGGVDPSLHSFNYLIRVKHNSL